MSDNKKVGPREQQLRELRKQRDERANKGKIDKVTKFKAKGIGKVVSLKGGKRGS
jgi:hypothetical protein